MKPYLNSSLSPKERAEDLLSRMSLDEKMAQVNCLFSLGEDWRNHEAEIAHGIGQVSTLDLRRFTSLQEVVEWQREIQETVMNNSEHQIPAIFHMEGLCGAFIQGAVSFPSGIARGSSWDTQLEEKIAQIVSRQELACGISQVLAPVLDISRDSRMGRQGETYGEDPTLAAALGCAYTQGVQSVEVDGRTAESVAKHFLGSQNSQGGIHGANCDIPERLLYEIYGKPFQAAIRESELKGIMPCYSSVNGEPLSISHKLLTEILREEMGFEGICTADYSAVANVHSAQKVGESFTEVGLLSMSAGMDIEMQNCVCFNTELKQWFSDGRAEMRILDRAVKRVLETKFRMGIFEHPFALGGKLLEDVFYHGEDQLITRQSALESMILLKNNGVLPIQKEIKKIVVVGCHAVNPRCFFGGYTHLSMVEAIHAVANSIAGIESGSIDQNQMVCIPGTQVQTDETEEFAEIIRQQKPECKSLLETLKTRLQGTEIIYAYGYPVAGNDLSHMEEALRSAEDADLLILTLGGKHGSCSVATMGEGVDGTDINLPYCQETFIKEASALKIPMIGVHFDGRPISSDAADQYLEAIIEAWSPAEMGAEAVADVLTGVYNPGGKLPVTVARNAGQIPIYYNHPHGSSYHQGESIGFKDYVDLPHTPRYFFGYGLSYTTFTYSGLQIKKEKIMPDEAVEFSFTIQNTGEYDGEEVVQIYLQDPYASMSRPVKELAGFRRIKLQKGERKTIFFTLKAGQTAFLDKDMRWKVEKGIYEILVGSSSEDIRQNGRFEITENAWIKGNERGFFATSEIE